MNCYFIMVPLRKKALKYGTPKPRYRPFKRTLEGNLKEVPRARGGWGFWFYGLGV